MRGPVRPRAHECRGGQATESAPGIGRPRRGGAFRQRACKPDPVASGHLSRRAGALAGRRGALRPTWTSPSRVDGPAWPCTGRGLPGRRVTTTPVRSYRTFSPLPVRGSRVAAPSAVCFCGTFPRLSPGGRYPPPCPVVSGLSSKGFLPLRVRSARPTDGRAVSANRNPERPPPAITPPTTRPRRWATPSGKLPRPCQARALRW